MEVEGMKGCQVGQSNEMSIVPLPETENAQTKRSALTMKQKSQMTIRAISGALLTLKLEADYEYELTLTNPEGESKSIAQFTEKDNGRAKVMSFIHGVIKEPRAYELGDLATRAYEGDPKWEDRYEEWIADGNEPLKGLEDGFPTERKHITEYLPEGYTVVRGFRTKVARKPKEVVEEFDF
jgi:hypothetical protein